MQDVFVRRLIELMENSDISQVELAKKIGTTNVTISRYIRGNRKPRIEIVSKIANIFNVSVDYLLGFSNTKNDDYSQPSKSIIELYKIIRNLGFLDSNNQLSNKQIDLIKKLLDANKDFIIPLKNNIDIINK